jgi:hypothetical protein
VGLGAITMRPVGEVGPGRLTPRGDGGRGGAGLPEVAYSWASAVVAMRQSRSDRVRIPEVFIMPPDRVYGDCSAGLGICNGMNANHEN